MFSDGVVAAVAVIVVVAVAITIIIIVCLILRHRKAVLTMNNGYVKNIITMHEGV